MHPARILLVDDDRSIQRTVGPLLASRGFDVELADNGSGALRACAERRPDLILLDLQLPDIDGLDVCRRIRERDLVPIIVLSGRTAEADIVLALDVGVDDYVTKPFGSEELMARIRTALRRTAPDAPERHGQVFFGDLGIDFDRRLAVRDGEQIHLTPKEFDFVSLLARRAGRLFTHRALLRALWGPHAIDQADRLWALVRQVRRKIEPDPARPSHVLSERGIGYRFAAPGETPALRRD